MAYNVLNPPALIGQRVGAAGGAMWIYKDGDDLATVTGVNYVTNGGDLGIKDGDCVMHIDTGDSTAIDLVALEFANGTAVGALASAIEPIAETSIALQSAGTGSILLGDIITFDTGDATEYEVTSGDADVSGGGTLTITPGLVVATVVGTAITVKTDQIVLSEGASGIKIIDSLGATITLSKADSGAEILFDRAAGIVVTLPASIPGMTFTFIVTVDLTAAAYAFVTDGAFLVGSLLGGIEGAATDETHFANGTTHVGVSMNKTTTGGLIGGCFTVTCLTTTLWKIEGNTSCTATPLTPFTT